MTNTTKTTGSPFDEGADQSGFLIVQQVSCPVEGMYSVYFAGKVKQPGSDYRCRLFHDRVMLEECHGDRILALGGTHITYAGPTALNVLPGYHAATTHGCADDKRHLVAGMEVSVDEEAIVARCLQQIRECDFVFAFIDDLTCYGTLCEIGYAAGIGKPVVLAISYDARELASETARTPFEWQAHGARRSELWFLQALPNVYLVDGTATEFFDVVRRKVWMGR